MESKAIARYIHQSPFKLRKTLNSIRGMSVNDALSYLHFSPEKAATVIEKTIRSAVSNIVKSNEGTDIDQNSLKFKDSNYLNSLLINSIYTSLILPAVFFQYNGLICKYWFFSLLILYIIFYSLLYSFAKKQ